MLLGSQRTEEFGPYAEKLSKTIQGEIVAALDAARYAEQSTLDAQDVPLTLRFPFKVHLGAGDPHVVMGGMSVGPAGFGNRPIGRAV